MRDVATEAAPARRDELARDERLRVTEIFLSLQGEAASVGWPTVFARLAGCPLRCRWCDTAYAFHGGSWWGFDAIEQKVASYGAQRVCVTGGEPLAQSNCRGLLTRLAARGYSVSLETSGALPIVGLDSRVTVVMDVKAPGSGESGRNRLDNLKHLRACDQAQFVLADRADYEWARAFVGQHDLAARTKV
ncbi:MAG: radical SAM protein, partial [Gammaproteobacteria bacterium]